MTLEVIGQHGPGIRDFAVLQELQSLKISIVAGALAATNIPVTGIALVDTLLSVLQVPANALTVDRTAQASITSAGNIQLSTTDTTGAMLYVFWYDKAPA